MTRTPLRGLSILLTMLAAGAFSLAVANAADATGKIEAGKPGYAAKGKDVWKDRARIVGKARSAPAFTVTVLDASGKQVKTAQAGDAKDGARAYEIEWLEPGPYTLRVSADGYKTLDVPNLEARANHDLRVDLEFSK